MALSSRVASLIIVLYMTGATIGFTIDDEFVVLLIGTQHGFGLIVEAVVETVPHFFIVMNCLSV